MIDYVENPMELKKKKTLLDLKMSLVRSQDTVKIQNQLYIYTVATIYATCKQLGIET